MKKLLLLTIAAIQNASLNCGEQQPNPSLMINTLSTTLFNPSNPLHLLFKKALDAHETGGRTLRYEACEVTLSHPFKANVTKQHAFEAGELVLPSQSVEWHFDFGHFYRLIGAEQKPDESSTNYSQVEDIDPTLSFFALLEAHKSKDGVASIIERTTALKKIAAQEKKTCIATT